MVKSNQRVINSSKIGIFERAYRYPKVCNDLYEKNMKYRSPGAVAISLAFAKNYNFVLFGGDMRSFDIEAALYINNDLHTYKNSNFLLLSKNIKIFDKLKKLLKNNRL